MSSRAAIGASGEIYGGTAEGSAITRAKLVRERDVVITVDVLGERARLGPESVALIHVPSRKEITYAELDARAVRCARFFVHTCGLRKGDRVCILSENRVEYVEAFFAAAKSGVILVPLGTRSTARELQQVLADCAPRCLMYSG